jgi:hypothetical protein
MTAKSRALLNAPEVRADQADHYGDTLGQLWDYLSEVSHLPTVDRALIEMRRRHPDHFQDEDDHTVLVLPCGARVELTFKV